MFLPVRTTADSTADAWADRLFCRCFWPLVFLGVIFRGIAAFTHLGILHVDEHQQFLEQAFRIVYGYGMTFWEQQRGMRHPLYPALLSGPLWLCERLGLDDPIVQLGILRLCVALPAFVGLVWIARRYSRVGDPWTGLIILGVASLSVDVIFVQVHPLSEVACTIPVLFALLCLPSHALIAGMLLGLSFGIRFQTGFLIAGILAMACYDVWGGTSRTFRRLLLGLGIALVGIAMLDLVFQDRWTLSPIEYVRANLVEKKSEHYGVSPWDQYFTWMSGGSRGLLALEILFLGLAFWKEWRLTLLTLLFLLAHSAVAHKEPRFMLPVLPLLLILFGRLYSEAMHLFTPRWRLGITLLVFMILCSLSIYRLPQVPWSDERFAPVSRLLIEASRQPELTGIALDGIEDWASGNYFFLRHNLPMLSYKAETTEVIRMRPEWQRGDINYLIVEKDRISLWADMDGTIVAEQGRWLLLRLEPKPAHP